MTEPQFSQDENEALAEDVAALRRSMTEDAGCDVAPQKWGHDSTDSLVERVMAQHLEDRSAAHEPRPDNCEVCAALTELAERLANAERTLAQGGLIEIERQEWAERLKAAERRSEIAERSPAWHTNEARKRAEAAEAQRDELVEALERDPTQPWDVDISDYGDEWVAGFLAGQENAASAALAKLRG